MATNIPLTGKFKVTCEYWKKGNWACGYHTGIDLVSDNKEIYGTCNGTVYKTGWDNSYGNYVVVKNSEKDNYHWYCHLSKIYVTSGQSVTRTTKIGYMGSTGNSSGTHLHFEIRKSCNCYGQNENPADYMRIPNQVGDYDSNNYQLSESNSNNTSSTGELKTLARNTNLREQPTTDSKIKDLYITNTTLYVLQPSVAQANGYTWDKVKIRVTGDEGYMINQNYK